MAEPRRPETCRLTRALEGLGKLRALEGGGRIPPPSPKISALIKAGGTKFAGWMGTVVKSVVCKFNDLRSVSSRSNEVTYVKMFLFCVASLVIAMDHCLIVLKCSKMGISDVLDITNDSMQRPDPAFDLRSPI